MAAVEHQRFADQPGREFGGIEGEFAAAQAADAGASARNPRVRVAGDGHAMRERKQVRSLHLYLHRCFGTRHGYVERRVTRYFTGAVKRAKTKIASEYML